MTQERWNRSIQLLREGRWEEGWPEHEWIRTARWDSKLAYEPTPTFGKPIWKGEPGTVLVNADFGMGDTIHFYRFLSLIEQKVLLRCDPDFARLFDVPVVSEPEGDYVIHMMALPRLLGSKKLNAFIGQPYLRPKNDPPGVLSVLNEMKFTKVGVCWAGSPGNPRDWARSLPEETLFRVEGLPLFHLVKHLPCPEGYVDLRKYMGDWNDTAHVLNQLDLIITVDTAIAHLAGALGRPTWLLLPLRPDWRWGGSGAKTFWYNSIRIFRQTTPEWGPVIADVKAALADFSVPKI